MYTGIPFEMPLGQLGYSGDDTPPLGYLTQADNVEIVDEQLRNLGGIKKFDATAVTGTPTLYGGFSYQPRAGTQRIVTGWSNGKVYKEFSADIDRYEIHDWASTLTGPVTFVKAGLEAAGENRKLLVFSEDNAPFYIDGDGTTSSALTASSNWTGTNQPSSAVFHDGRVVAFGDRDNPHTLYFTPVTDHTDFSVAGGAKVFTIAPGVGTRIVGAASILGTRLYVFKDDGLVWIDTTNIANATFLNTNVFSEEIGLAGPRAIARVGSDIIFMDQNARIRSLAAADTSNDLADSDLSARFKLNKWIKTYIDRRNLKFVQLTYDSDRQMLYINVPGKTSNVQNTRILINLQNPQVPRITFDIDRGSLFQSSFLWKENSGQNRVLVGGSGGFVYKTDEADREVDGSAFTSTFTLPETGCGQQYDSVKKRFDRLELKLEGTINANIACQVFIDGVAYGSYNISLSGPSSNELDVFALDSSRLSSKTQEDHSIRLRARGRKIMLQFSQSGLRQNFRLLSATLYFKPLNYYGET